MRVALFGGSFNPPHLGHLVIAETMREAFALDEVWWIPSKTPPHKDPGGLVEASHRLEMTRLAIEGNRHFRLETAEFERPGASYTVDTVRDLQAREPRHAFFLLIGGDSLRDLATWRDPDEIVRTVPLLVYRRPGADPGALPPEYADRIHFADAPLLEISATEIRARCRAGRSIRYLVPEPVRSYIEAHALYGRRESDAEAGA